MARNGFDGEDGVDGEDGSPDTPAQVIAKLLGVDGSGSSLDADELDGFDSSAFGRVSGNRVVLDAPFQSGQQTIVTDDQFLAVQGGRFEARCSNASGFVSTTIYYRNTSGSAQEVWADGGGRRVVEPNNTVDSDSFSGVSIDWLIVSADRETVTATTGEASATVAGGNCVFAGQAAAAN